jgi:hypothetical protein
MALRSQALPLRPCTRPGCSELVEWPSDASGAPVCEGCWDEGYGTDARSFMDLSTGGTAGRNLANLSIREVVALRARAAVIGRLPHGQRQRERRALAEEYGVSERTVERYRRGRLVTVTVDGWQAAFTARADGHPCQVSAWSIVGNGAVSAPE